MRGRRLIGSTALLRITSLNLNGIRSAFRKGLQPWMEKHGADILCLQEIKIADADLTDDLRHPPGYTGHFHHAEKKGYSGVGLYCATPPSASTSAWTARSSIPRAASSAPTGKTCRSSAPTCRPVPAAMSANRPSTASWTASARGWTA